MYFHTQFTKRVKCVANFIFIMIISLPVYCETSTINKDWPRWRGPNGNGISLESDWNPRALAKGPKIQWSVNVGKGYSNVSIKGKYLYTMGSENGEDIIYCLNTETGEEIWRFSYPSSLPGPQATPSVDEKFLYSLSKDGQLYCLKALNGKFRWKRNLVKDFQVQMPDHGFAGSPIVEGNLVLINANRTGIALNKKTGDAVWVSKPHHGKHVDYYASPVIYTNEEERFAALYNHEGVSSIEVKTGKINWKYRWTSVANAADPVLVGNNMFVSSDYDSGGVMLEIYESSPKVLWQNKNMMNHFSTTVHVDGYLYGSSGFSGNHNNSVRCIDAETGTIMWEIKMKTASITVADGKLIILNEKGKLTIAEANPSAYGEISNCTIPDQIGHEIWWTPPVLYRGFIYCRNDKGDLVCIDVRI
jgi:outer membrane protein assembly factor BamB